MRPLPAAVLTLCAAVLLTGCSGLQQTPTTWEAKGNDVVEYMSWTQTADGNISGLRDFSTVGSDFQVNATSQQLAGTLANGKVTMTAGGETLTGTITGDTLTLSGVADGKPFTEILAPSDQKTYEADLAALVKTSKAKAAAKQADAARTAYSDAVGGVKASVGAVTTSLAGWNAASAAESTALTAYKTFYTSMMSRTCIPYAQTVKSSNLSSTLEDAVTALDTATADLKEATSILAAAVNAPALNTAPTAQFTADEAKAAADLATRAEGTVSTGQKAVSQGHDAVYNWRGNLSGINACP